MSRNSQRSIYSKYKTYFSHTFAKVKNDPLLKLFLTLQFITVGPLWFWSAQFWIYFYVPFLRSDGRPNLTRTFCFTFLFSSSVGSGVGSNLQVGGTMPARSAVRKIFDVPPTFLLCPHVRGHNDCLLPTERQLNCPLVSALQSAHLLVKSEEGQ